MKYTAQLEIGLVDKVKTFESDTPSAIISLMKQLIKDYTVSYNLKEHDINYEFVNKEQKIIVDFGSYISNMYIFSETKQDYNQLVKFLKIKQEG